MSEQQTKGTLRAAKRKAHYKAQFARTDANAKRRLRHHLRAHPADTTAIQCYAQRYGAPESVGLSSKGMKRGARYLKEALV